MSEQKQVKIVIESILSNINRKLEPLDIHPKAITDEINMLLEAQIKCRSKRIEIASVIGIIIDINNIPITLNELAEAAEIELRTITKCLRKYKKHYNLQERGYEEKIEKFVDRGVMKLGIGNDGKKLIKRVINILMKEQGSVFGNMYGKEHILVAVSIYIANLLKETRNDLSQENVSYALGTNPVTLRRYIRDIKENVLEKIKMLTT